MDNDYRYPLMKSPKSFKNWSWLAKIGLIIAAGVFAYLICGLFDISMLYGSIVISLVTCYLFASVFDRKHPFKVVGIVCLIGFMIALSAGMTGFGRGFVDGFTNGYNQGYSQFNNR